MKKLLFFILSALMVISLLPIYGASQDFTPATNIVIPTGKTPYAMPADVYSTKPIKLAAIGNDLNEFSLLVADGIKWAKDVLSDRNCTVDYYGLPEFNAVAEEEVMRNCITLGYNGVTIFGFSEVLQPVIQEAVDAGIVVTTWNTDAGKGSARMGFFGEEGYSAAQRLGKFAVEKFGEAGGKYAIITGNFAVYSHELRRTGFRSIVDENPNYVLVSEQQNLDKTETAYDQTTNLMLANPDLKFIYVTAGGPEGAAKAIQDAGNTGKVYLFCHDWTQETVRYAKAGVVTGCLDQDPFNQGAAPLISMFNYLAAGVPIKDLNYFSGGILTPENVRDYYPD
jgi:ABC-type sugar transport system substrate-binding protein